jgi:hypothetical protein
MSIIINATQHVANEEQHAVGVWDLPESTRKSLSQMITFEDIPSLKEIEERAEKVVALLRVAQGGRFLPKQQVMIGGAPYFMAPLERALRNSGACPIYAFSKRESVDEPQKDGSIKKVAVFRHSGFVEV